MKNIHTKLMQRIVELVSLAFDRQLNATFITHQSYHPYGEQTTGACLGPTTSDSSVKPVLGTPASLASSVDVPFLPELSDV